MAKTPTNGENGVEANLQPRKIPTQKRAEKTVAHLLEVSALLLDEVGFDRFNTNLLAERANVRIATVYRYFPNKLAILSVLVDDWFNILRKHMSFWDEIADPSKDWRGIITENLDIYHALTMSHTGVTAIRRALQAVPELREQELSFIKELAIQTVNSLKVRGVKTRGKKLFTVAGVFMMSASSSIDLIWMAAGDDKDLADDILEEVKLNTLSYFANYLD